METSSSTQLSPCSQGRAMCTCVIPDRCSYKCCIARSDFGSLLCVLPFMGADNFHFTKAFLSASSVLFQNTIPEGQLSFMSLGFPGYSSSSSSTASLEGKRNYSKKKNSTSSSKKALTRVSSASSKISAGMVCCVFSQGEFTAALSTCVVSDSEIAQERYL